MIGGLLLFSKPPSCGLSRGAVKRHLSGPLRSALDHMTKKKKRLKQTNENGLRPTRDETREADYYARRLGLTRTEAFKDASYRALPLPGQDGPIRS